MPQFVRIREDELESVLESGQTRIEDLEERGLVDNPAFTDWVKQGKLKITPVGEHVNVQLVD